MRTATVDLGLGRGRRGGPRAAVGQDYQQDSQAAQGGGCACQAANLHAVSTGPSPTRFSA